MTDTTTTTEARHAIDFRSIDWFGTAYSFTRTQAACVAVLWTSWENDTPDVAGRTVLDLADSDAAYISRVFRKHPAWGVMIQNGATRGTVRLRPPDDACCEKVQSRAQ